MFKIPLVKSAGSLLPGDVEEGEAKGGGQGEVAEETESNVHFLAG